MVGRMGVGLCPVAVTPRLYLYKHNQTSWPIHRIVNSRQRDDMEKMALRNDVEKKEKAGETATKKRRGKKEKKLNQDRG